MKTPLPSVAEQPESGATPPGRRVSDVAGHPVVLSETSPVPGHEPSLLPPDRAWQGVNLAFPGGPHDVSGAGLLSVVVSNACDAPFRVHATLATGAWQGRRPSYFATLRPGETRDIPLRLWFAPWVLDAPLDLPGMKNAPKAAADSTFDLRACTAIEVNLGKAAGLPRHRRRNVSAPVRIDPSWRPIKLA